jgi:hypothetical protein
MELGEGKAECDPGKDEELEHVASSIFEPVRSHRVAVPTGLSGGRDVASRHHVPETPDRVYSSRRPQLVRICEARRTATT